MYFCIFGSCQPLNHFLYTSITWWIVHSYSSLGTISKSVFCSLDRCKENEKKNFKMLPLIHFLNAFIILLLYWFHSEVKPTLITVWVEKGHRPNLDAIPSDAPAEITDIIQKCWVAEPTKRPVFKGKCKNKIIKAVKKKSFKKKRQAILNMFKQKLRWAAPLIIVIVLFHRALNQTSLQIIFYFGPHISQLRVSRNNCTETLFTRTCLQHIVYRLFCICFVCLPFIDNALVQVLLWS